MSEAEKILCECACGAKYTAKPAKDGGPKTPPGWRTLDGTLTCGKCVAAAYYTRGYRFEIRGLADPNDDRDFGEFRQACAAASAASARFANWLVREMFKSDPAVDAGYQPERTAKGTLRLAPLPAVDYYHAVKAGKFPGLAPSSACSLAKMVRGWYTDRRWDALVACNRSVESYRFGRLPVEIPKQKWRIEALDDGKLAIRTQAGPGQSWLLSIYGEQRAIGALRACRTGEGVPLALKIVRGAKRTRDGELRRGWYLRVSIMLPRKANTRQKHQEITLTLGHDGDALLWGQIDGSDRDEDVFTFHGCEVKNIIVGGDKTDRTMQVDLSMMRGIWSRRKLARWSVDRTRQSEARQRKISEQLKLAAASLARWCAAHGVTSVDYDTTDRGYVPHFPYYRLRDLLRSALEGRGIALHVLEDTTSPANQEESGAVARPERVSA